MHNTNHLNTLVYLGSKVASRILGAHPDLVREFYRARPDAACRWFGGFDSRGIAHFSPGARALANYALTRRDTVGASLQAFCPTPSLSVKPVCMLCFSVVHVLLEDC